MPAPDYDLSLQIGWSRRAGGDQFQNTSETIAADGTPRITLNADGAINITSVEVNFVVISPSDYTSEDNTITFTNNIPVEGDDVLVRYASARYTDAQTLDFLKDAARGVRADMKYHWQVNENTAIVSDPKYELHDPMTDLIYGEIEQLIIYRAAVCIYADKSNAAAEGAILIKNGDTTIETGKTAAATEKALTRLLGLYKDAVKKARSEGFMGNAQNMFDFYDFPDGSRVWRYNRWL